MRCLLASLRPSFLSTLSLRRATRRAHVPPVARCHFYPRSPCGERHGLDSRSRRRHNISIHALLAESDAAKKAAAADAQKFLSTLSLRRATKVIPTAAMYGVFLSTLSLRRATNHPSTLGRNWAISIHALLAESDSGYKSCSSRSSRFLSTLSLRRATRAQNQA